MKDFGYVMASKMLVDGKRKVRYMYKEKPDNENDSGWRFFCGDEDDEYINNPDNVGIYDIDTIIALDKDISPILNHRFSEVVISRNSDDGRFFVEPNKKKKEYASIYTIFMCQKIEGKYAPSFGCTRTVGFFLKEKDAVEAVINNELDIAEYCYRYAIIEKINEGIYHTDTSYKPRVFKYDVEEDRFREIEMPVLDGFAGFSIG